MFPLQGAWFQSLVSQGSKILHTVWQKEKKNRSVVARAEMGDGVKINWLTKKGHKRTFKSNGNVLYLDYEDGISICQKSSNSTHKMGTFYCM